VFNYAAPGIQNVVKVVFVPSLVNIVKPLCADEDSRFKSPEQSITLENSIGFIKVKYRPNYIALYIMPLYKDISRAH